MTTQAKNRVLAYIVIAMMLLVVIVGQTNKDTPSGTATVLLPKDQPVLVAVAEEPSIDEAEFECLRTNLYFEAGNQTRKGMEAAALVVLTRMKTKSYPATACGVVKVKAFNKRKGRWECAFSWYCDGKADAPVLTVKANGKRVPNKAEIEAWERATNIAALALKGKLKDFLGGATHYHADYVTPGWVKKDSHRIKLLTTVGTHIFYRDIALKLKRNA